MESGGGTQAADGALHRRGVAVKADATPMPMQRIGFSVQG